MIQHSYAISLIIADDEKIIRETIRDIIPWEEYGVSVVATCKDGIEAISNIRNLKPDIILTDIMMPGYSGLDIIEQTLLLDYPVEFIILSGYSEFAYARAAMKFGVKHYLLKPCNENQIVEAVRTAMQDITEKKSFGLKSQAHTMHRAIVSSLVHLILYETLPHPERITTVISFYAQILDFFAPTYQLKEHNITIGTSHLPTWEEIKKKYFSGSGIPLLFCLSDGITFITVEEAPSSSSLKCSKSYWSLNHVLLKLIDVFSCANNTLTFIDQQGIHCIQSNFISYMSLKSDELFNGIFPPEKKTDFHMLVDKCFSDIDHVEDAKVLCTYILVKIATFEKLPCGILPLADALSTFDGCHSVSDITQYLEKTLKKNFQTSTDNNYGECVDKVMRYVNANIAEESLSLKWLADNVVFKNVDYVSKQFLKRTGMKFSFFLNQTRVEKAKSIIAEKNTDKLYLVASQVGYEKNPQYFGQIFKRFTGMTLSEYKRKLCG